MRYSGRMETFAAAAIALYAAHHVGDYWVQTHHQSMHKGDAGGEGIAQCLLHVLSYTVTQAAFLAAVILVTGLDANPVQVLLALAISGVTHYAADRREYGLMFKLARRMPWKADFLKLGVPRTGWIWAEDGKTTVAPRDDNPSLGTGAWALDQSWHIFWGVFVAALVIAA